MPDQHDIKHSENVYDLNNYAISFFFTFSRFEYSLKCNGFYKKRKKYEYAEVDWSTLIRNINPEFFTKASACAQYIIDNPPKLQIIDNGGLSWRDCASPNDVNSLIFAVRTVRNNLFHGGKDIALNNDSARDMQLLKDAQRIIYIVLDELPFLKRAFYEGAN